MTSVLFAWRAVASGIDTEDQEYTGKFAFTAYSMFVLKKSPPRPRIPQNPKNWLLGTLLTEGEEITKLLNTNTLLKLRQFYANSNCTSTNKKTSIEIAYCNLQAAKTNYGKKITQDNWKTIRRSVDAFHKALLDTLKNELRTVPFNYCEGDNSFYFLNIILSKFTLWFR